MPMRLRYGSELISTRALGRPKCDPASTLHAHSTGPPRSPIAPVAHDVLAAPRDAPRRTCDRAAVARMVGEGSRCRSNSRRRLGSVPGTERTDPMRPVQSVRERRPDETSCAIPAERRIQGQRLLDDVRLWPGADRPMDGQLSPSESCAHRVRDGTSPRCHNEAGIFQ